MNQSEDPPIVGDEELNEDAMAPILQLVRPEERIVALSGFDFESKVIAVTTHRAMISDDLRGVEFNFPYTRNGRATRDGRTLVLLTGDGSPPQRFQMRRNETVAELVTLIRGQQQLFLSGEHGATMTSEQPLSMAAGR